MLSALIDEGKRVDIYLVNGLRLVGQVESFDKYVVLLRSPAGAQLIYKHAISTIQPEGAKPPAGDSVRPLLKAGGDDSKRSVDITRKGRRTPTSERQ